MAGKVILVATVVVNVVAKAPDVVRLPPKVMVLLPLSMPVPPCPPKITPLILASVTEPSAIDCHAGAVVVPKLTSKDFVVVLKIQRPVAADAITSR